MWVIFALAALIWSGNSDHTGRNQIKSVTSMEGQARYLLHLEHDIQNCWVVDVGSQAADVTVVVGMSLDRDGRVVGGSLRRLSATGGNENAANAAFEAARRAILRCQRGGYNLPIEKYEHWRDVEITFNPEKMRRR